MTSNSTVCAISSAPGNGALAIIRVTGSESYPIVDKIFSAADKQSILEKQANTLHFGRIVIKNKTIDEVVVSLFRAPHSYTGEDLIEISCHGSTFIQAKIIETLLDNGASLARPGEFTQRAFLNGKMDLSQAEAVADLIASTSEAAHKLAIQQLRGGVSGELSKLRERLLHFISMIELELDFSEEDVEFANRDELKQLLNEITSMLGSLKDSFSLGNAVKNGIPVAIIGQPNVGKSTLLNALLNEERAIVSEVAGTTRDALEDTISIDGYLFRFIDTAGLRKTRDVVEAIGIQRTMEKIRSASLVLFLFDINESLNHIRTHLNELKHELKDKHVLVIINKTDLFTQEITDERYRNISDLSDYEIIRISAKKKINLDVLREKLVALSRIEAINQYDVVLTNSRHYEAISRALTSIEHVEKGLAEGLPTDLLAMDIRQALHYLGEITGEISTDEVLGNIFKNFCIGK
ncbi:MAG: tRNA uridine-5-carboxymethylaminomethyl(34) synthesis GTPase MnmE [Bacteroidota bacterium]